MYPDSDPRSWNYIRQYKRPIINFKKIAIMLLCFLAILILVFYLVHSLYGMNKAVITTVMCSLVFGFFTLKKTLITMVKVYQRYAPISVRSNCRFEPSCSEYMIQSLEKYGVIKGLLKGINRIYRCSTGDGGFDYLD